MYVLASLYSCSIYYRPKMYSGRHATATLTGRGTQLYVLLGLLVVADFLWFSLHSMYFFPFFAFAALLVHHSFHSRVCSISVGAPFPLVFFLSIFHVRVDFAAKWTDFVIFFSFGLQSSFTEFIRFTLSFTEIWFIVPSCIFSVTPST